MRQRFGNATDDRRRPQTPKARAKTPKGTERRRTLVLKLEDGALDSKLVARLEIKEVLGHLALLILFDEEGELAGEVGGGDGGVGADDGLALGVNEGSGGVRGGLDDDA